MKRLCFVISLVFFSAFSIRAQRPEETFRLGLQAIEMQHYSLARLAFERLLFFEQDSFLLGSMKQLGLIATHEGRLNEATGWFRRASAIAVSDQERAWFDLQCAAAYLKQNDPKMGLMFLLGIPENIPDSLLYYGSFLKGVAYFMELNFEESHRAFLSAVNPLDQKSRVKIDSLFRELHQMSHPRPRLARLLSIFVPGLGPFYAGDVKNGINSLLLTGGLLSLGIYALFFYTPIDAIIAIAPWFQRYYMGGYKRAEKIAADRLNQKRNHIYLEILDCFPD
jgi:tetratricopeptide (TPR) repeat protein